MEALIGIVVLVAIVVVFSWMRNAFWKAASQKVLDRKGHARGQSAIKSHTVFVVPSMQASEVIRTIVAALGYPTTKSNLGGNMSLIGATDTQAVFALGNRFGQAWESRLSVVDQPDGAHGEYQVVRWTLSDGIVSGSKEMDIVERRIGEIANSIGGTVKVTIPQ
jgi:hypothetical protein